MQLHNLKPNHKLKKSRRIGRGGKRGSYSGRGIKGQKARAGAKIRPAARDLMMKLPKQRGVRFKSFKKKPIILNLEYLENNFQSGEMVTPAILTKLGALHGAKKKVKILGDGEITKKLTLNGISVSQSARAKIEKAGGTIK